MGHHDAKPPPKTMPLHLAPRPDVAAEPMLIVVEGLEPGRRFALRPDATTIGRGPENHVVLPSPAVSNEHARIVVRDGQFWIEDRESTNGVAVNGSRVAVDEPRVLANGDAIRLSDHLLFFHRGSSRQQDHGADIEIDLESAAARADELIEQLRREAPPGPPA